ncbi:hypothetical protein [Streptomyces sp. NBC_00878]|nr:hypothetical protein [Streptomyces sp. NBC_00878]MCX4911848.1 hypothetical protein [Streptomyces sp. NBC_00878]
MIVDLYEAVDRVLWAIAYGAIRRIRAYKVGAYLRARADTATGYERTNL